MAHREPCRRELPEVGEWLGPTRTGAKRVFGRVDNPAMTTNIIESTPRGRVVSWTFPAGMIGAVHLVTLLAGCGADGPVVAAILRRGLDRGVS